MITLILYRTKDCPACKVMTNNVYEAISNVNRDICVKIRNADNYSDNAKEELNIEQYPTVIFTNDDNIEMARLVGTYPVEYIIGILEKV